MDLQKQPAAAASHPTRNRLGVVALILGMLLVGPVMIAIGVGLRLADDQLLETGTRTTGTITEVQDGVEASDLDFRVDYRSTDDVVHSVWESWDISDRPSVGDEVVIVYRATDPGAAVVEGYGGEGEWMTGLGAVFTVILGGTGVMMLVMAARGRSERAQARRAAIQAAAGQR
ncbi:MULTISPECIES: DUF3592 domain-containing protein [Plantibacter]|uniref:DUF3592 domain-containing protein n=1 Tax=Plantibacter TaxID=190323 RepID=UPI00099D8A1A|nr:MULTISPECIES: DUF3592 domain-containing protein [Plantibacter]AQX80928.1 hypothetical protein BWO91_13995 [Plantibacter flavus]VXC48586.1 conserved hypothetical protein [Plantibacter sp. T3]